MAAKLLAQRCLNGQWSFHHDELLYLALGAHHRRAKPRRPGRLHGINSAVAQVSGGIASAVAGLIVVKTETGYLENYPVLGVVVTVAMAITMMQLYKVHKALRERRRLAAINNDLTK